MGSIIVTNLGKAYKQYPNRWSRLAEWVNPLSKPRHQLHWVLKDINFTVQPGEAVGIIGINGAGKSTLLKMITGTTQPTTGSVQISGRVAALLELGMGFHPDFTGRQNVSMAGQLLGYSVEEITRLMPGIEGFAEIGEYIDQPVRVYSSGMQVRLAFAVSTAARPDVLIIDEALSVGDAAFQRKCFQRIESYRFAGTTLLFVSHDVETVKKLCDGAIFIREGRLAQWGPAKQVCDEYERYLFGAQKHRKLAPPAGHALTSTGAAQFDPSLLANCGMAYGNGKATITNVRLKDNSGSRINVVQTGVAILFSFDVYVNEEAIRNPSLHIQVKTTDGVVIYGVNTDHLRQRLDQLDAAQGFTATFELANPLAPGLYFFSCGVKEGGASSDAFCSRIVDGAILKVIDRDASTVARGMVDLRAQLEINNLA